jgi:hypothetical protein
MDKIVVAFLKRALNIEKFNENHGPDGRFIGGPMESTERALHNPTSTNHLAAAMAHTAAARTALMGNDREGVEFHRAVAAEHKRMAVNAKVKEAEQKLHDNPSTASMRIAGWAHADAATLASEQGNNTKARFHTNRAADLLTQSRTAVAV